MQKGRGRSGCSLLALWWLVGLLAPTLMGAAVLQGVAAALIWVGEPCGALLRVLCATCKKPKTGSMC
jgi:hypothetical protein